MNVVYVSTYVIKYEKQKEYQALIEKFLKFKKANPKAFEGVKSFRLFQQEYGGGSCLEDSSRNLLQKLLTVLNSS